MAKSKNFRMGGDELDPVVSAEVNADGTVTLLTATDSYSQSTPVTATIAASGSLSGEVDTGGRRLAGIVMPAAWTAAVITFQAAAKSTADGGTYRDLYDDLGNEVQVQAAASRSIGLDALAYALAPFRFLKVRSGTGASAVNQAVQADLGLVFK